MSSAVRAALCVALASFGCGSDSAPADAPLSVGVDAPPPDARATTPDGGRADAGADAPDGGLPEGPEILQVMVVVDDQAVDFLTDADSGYAMTFGFLPEWDLCYLSNGPSADCTELAVAPDCTCGNTFDGVALTCAQSGMMIGHCVDSTATMPRVTHAKPYGNSIRVVVDEPLDGLTLEHFACACQGDLEDHSPARCSGEAWATNPFDCSGCSGDASTKGRCMDVDMNGLPDLPSLFPGVSRITCGGAVATGSQPVPTCPTGWTGGASGTCVHVSEEGEGSYYPAGNQLISPVIGLAGVGPAINITPTSGLPVRSDCSIEISASVKDNQGRSLNPPAETPRFRTDDLRLALTTPAGGKVHLSPGGLETITVAASTTLDPTSLAPTDVTLTDTNTTTVVTASGVTVRASDFDATLPKQTLVLGHVYRVTVAGGITDTFGIGRTAPFTSDFTVVSQ